MFSLTAIVYPKRGRICNSSGSCFCSLPINSSFFGGQELITTAEHIILCNHLLRVIHLDGINQQPSIVAIHIITCFRDFDREFLLIVYYLEMILTSIQIVSFISSPPCTTADTIPAMRSIASCSYSISRIVDFQVQSGRAHPFVIFPFLFGITVHLDTDTRVVPITEYA